MTQSDRDLIERARLHKTWRDSHGELNDTPNKMADRIQALSAEVEMLRAALEPFAATGEVCEITLNVQHFRNASQALKGANNG